MRDYGKLYSGFWTSSDTQSMSDDGKLLSAYLLTCHHSTIIGCFRLPDGYVSDDLGWSSERVSKGFVELFAKGFATRNEHSKWVVIHKYIKWNQPENPNQVKAAVKAFNQVPDECGVKPLLASSLSDFCEGFDVDILKPFLNRSETISKPVVVTEAVTEAEGLPQATPSKKRKPSKTTISDSFTISEAVKAWADANGHSRLNERLAHFTNLAKAKAYEYADWDAAFRNAIADDWAKLGKATPKADGQPFDVQAWMREKAGIQ